jgi:uncharacterized protein HemY
MAHGLESGDAALAVRLASLSVALAPEDVNSLDTLGVAFYRAGKFSNAVEILEKSQRGSGSEQRAAFGLLFLAMAHQKLGHMRQARDCLKQAEDWFESNRKTLLPSDGEQLTKFRAEAEAEVLGHPRTLPANVFAGSDG